MFLYFGGLGNSTNRIFPSSSFIPQATTRPLLEVSLHVCAIQEIAPLLKLLAKRLRNSGSPSGLAVTHLDFYFLYSGRLNTVTELNGFHENANHATVEWQCLNLHLTVVMLTLSGSFRDIQQT